MWCNEKGRSAKKYDVLHTKHINIYRNNKLKKSRDHYKVKEMRNMFK